MRPVLLAEDQATPADALAVDCSRADAKALYTHWQGHPAPAAIIADTSTAILLRASLDADRWLTGFEVCVNDHVDVDGLLAMAIACHPVYGRQFGPLLVGAAAFGDFTSWPGPEAAALALTLQQRLAAATDQQALVDDVVDNLESIVASSRELDEQGQAQIDLILGLRNGFMGKEANHPLVLIPQDAYTILRGPWHHGHHGAGPTTVHQPDDCPPWAVDGFVNESHHRLLRLDCAEGSAWCLSAPPHSWAHTIRLPQVPWPDCSGIAAELNAADQGPGTWLAGDDVRQHGFTWLLARVGDDGALAPSLVDPDRVIAAIESVL